MRTLALAALALSLATLSGPGWALSAQDNAAGLPIAWRADSVEVQLDPATGGLIPGSLQALQGAASAWAAAPSAPRIDVGAAGPSTWGFAQGAANQNSVHLINHDFPFEHRALAYTVLTSNAATGEVLDADVLVDLSRNQFALLGVEGLLGVPDAPFDLQNTLTHELGHVLGLTEDEADPAATMYPRSAPGEVSKRYITDEDRESVRIAYLRAGPTTRAGFACVGRARVAPGPRAGGLALAGGALALLLLASVAMRAQRRHARQNVGTALVAFGLLAGAAAVPAGTPTAPSAAVARTADGGAEVISTRVERRGALLWTRAVVRDDDGTRREVERPGGTLDGIEQRVTHMPAAHQLRVGERVRLERNQDFD